MATTAGGTYYAASTETLTAYPALSLNLANQLESRLAAKLAGVKADTAPATPATNDVWLDTSGAAGVWKIWNGSAWVSFSGAGLLTSADVSSTTGSPTITSGGGYTVYKFTGSGSITFGKAGLCDVLVVGGGGAGGANNAKTSVSGRGGGGAGGYIENTFYLPSGTSTITIGGGGSGVAGPATNGVTTRVSYLYSIGGARGKGEEAYGGSTSTAMVGGSGGGGWNSLAANTGTSAQGFDGGAMSGSTGGGGGGAGEAGSTDGAGEGGDGTDSSIDGSSTTRGGGGGGGSTTSGRGGTGGGGAGGSTDAAGSNASVNTGGGGGGAGNSSGTAYIRDGGNGGSGIVIVRVVT